MLSSCDGIEKFKVSSKTLTVRAAINSLKPRDSGYDWQLQNGMIVMLPSSGTPALLALRLQNFDTKSEVTANEALGMLLNLPQFRSKLLEIKAEIKPELGMMPIKRSGASLKETGKKFHFKLNNTTVIDVLNAIVKAHGTAIWSYDQYRCRERNLIRIGFLAQ